MKCSRCCSSRIVEGEFDAFSTLALRQTPGVPSGMSPGLWFRDAGIGPVVNVCIDCGYIEFRVSNLDALREKVKNLGIEFKDDDPGT